MRNGNTSNTGDDWSVFLAEHAEDFDDIANSRSAKSFEKHAKKAERKNLEEHIDHNNSSKNDNNLSSLLRSAAGPRDNTRSSWLDVDSTMEDYGDDFVPPNPTLKNISTVNLILWIVFIAGIAGIILTAFLPFLASFVGIISAILILLGGAGLLMNRKENNSCKNDYEDFGYGSRVQKLFKQLSIVRVNIMIEHY